MEETPCTQKMSVREKGSVYTGYSVNSPFVIFGEWGFFEGKHKTKLKTIMLWNWHLGQDLV